ncbi:MAG TPA: hypothetical protein VMI72_12575 [Roseiarcus sp.]|nr:hypothetical protein [Roseiarcus sp.]
MSMLARAGLVALGCFVCGLIGFAMQGAAPAQMLTDAKSMIGSIAGLVSLLLALVLGLVIWTSHSVYTTQIAEALSLGPVVLQLDHVFEQLGPRGLKGRALLKSQVLSHRHRFWGDGRQSRASSSYAISRSDSQDMADYFASLDPANDHERQLVATARQLSSSMIQTQLLMARQLATPLSPILIIIVVGWALLLFFAYGLSSAPNLISVVMEALGSTAVASAFLLILQLSQPYDGLFRISPAGIDQVIAAIGGREKLS